MPINSRSKGKRGELEFSKYLQSKGYEARRGQQYSGGDTSQDVVHDVPGVHLEVKRVEAGNLYHWLEQAKRDAVEGKVPIVAHRRNNKEWVAVMSMDDLFDMLLQRGA